MASLLRLRRSDGPTKSLTSAGADSQQKAPRLELMALPTEIHLAISKHLIYPDALSLKHTNRHFYHVVHTGISLKVEWLLERRRLHLECPNDRGCEFGTDQRFCRGSVPLLMKRRREHIECESRPGLGCLVFGTKTCSHRPKLTFWKRRFNVKLTVELWGLLLALIPLAVAWMWMLGHISLRF